MSKLALNDLLAIIDTTNKSASSVLPPAPPKADPPDEEEHVPVGVHGLVAATSKLLAVNRGLIPTDDRDSLEFKRLFTPDKLFRERVRMDSSRMRGKLVRLASKRRTLDGLLPYAFDGDMEGVLIGNPLSSPLEEINPMALATQARRVTMMGPGGVGSSDAITPGMQAIHGSQFGFICPLSGPESEKIGVDARLAWGAKFGSDGKIYQQFRDPRKNKLVWKSAEDLRGKVLKLPD